MMAVKAAGGITKDQSRFAVDMAQLEWKRIGRLQMPNRLMRPHSSTGSLLHQDITAGKAKNDVIKR
jgi:hypothetical protein